MAHQCGCGHGSEGNAEIVQAGIPIRAEETVGDIARRHPPALEILKESGINHCCGAHLTLREAAASAGVPIETLLAALNESREGQAPAERAAPLALADLPAARRVQLDVRQDIRRGKEPFARIMAAVTALGPDQVLELRAPFEPIPLYDVLGRRGFAHWTEPRAVDDWSVWFYRTGTPLTERCRAATPGAGERVLDVRGLEPPQPMVRVLEEIDRLAPGTRLEVHHDRRPLFLYPQLEDRGFRHETDEPTVGLVRIRIWKGA